MDLGCLDQINPNDKLFILISKLNKLNMNFYCLRIAMFNTLFQKLQTLEEHHQVLFSLVVVLGIVLVSWGIEKILEEYIFPTKPLHGYFLVITFGLFLLWLTKHILLRVM